MIQAWKQDAQMLVEKGLMDAEVVDILDNLNLDDSKYWNQFNLAENFVINHSQYLTHHPVSKEIVSGITFSDILANYHYYAQSQALTEQMVGYMKWIEESYQDGENPFPFETIQRKYVQKTEDKKNAKLLAKLLDLDSD